MANRVTTIEVEQIMDLDSSVTTETIAKFIGQANRLVTNRFTGDTTLSVATLADIECWLTAHMLALTPHARTASVERLGEARVDYTGKFGEGLKSTPYGQMVLSLDTTGKMATIGKPRAYLKAIGGWNDD